MLCDAASDAAAAAGYCCSTLAAEHHKSKSSHASWSAADLCKTFQCTLYAVKAEYLFVDHWKYHGLQQNYVNSPTICSVGYLPHCRSLEIESCINARFCKALFKSYLSLLFEANRDRSYLNAFLQKKKKTVSRHTSCNIKSQHKWQWHYRLYDVPCMLATYRNMTWFYAQLNSISINWIIETRRTTANYM